MAGLNLEVLNKVVVSKFNVAFGEMLGEKDMVVDPKLIKYLDSFVGMKYLRSKDVTKVYYLNKSDCLSGCNQRVFLVRPTIQIMKKVAQYIVSDQKSDILRKYMVLVVPRRLHICDLVLEQEGVFGKVKLHELELGFACINEDLLSLENDILQRSFFQDGDITWLHTVAESIISLQKTFGTIPVVCGKGQASSIVNKLVNVLAKDRSSNSLKHSTTSSKIDQIILLDRSLDYVTPLCSQLTYEGMMDDVYDIKCGELEIDAQILDETKSGKIKLTSNNLVFPDIRDKHFSSIFKYLKEKSQRCEKEVESFKNKQMNVNEMKNFVKDDLKEITETRKWCANYIMIAEDMFNKKTKITMKFPILDRALFMEHSLIEEPTSSECLSFVEECIHRQYDMIYTLKMMCLLCQVNSGLDRRTFLNLKEQFLRSYGFHHIVTFFNLKKVGLFYESSATAKSAALPTSSSIEANLKGIADKFSATSIGSSILKKDTFKQVCRKLSLVPRVEQNVVQSPNDMSYVLGGAYIPLNCRLAEQAIERDGWKGIEDVIKMLPGEHFGNPCIKSAKGGGSNMQPHKNKTVVVYFIGGITFTEIAALRFLAKQKKCRIIIATTNMINSKKLLENCIN